MKKKFIFLFKLKIFSKKFWKLIFVIYKKTNSKLNFRKLIFKIFGKNLFQKVFFDFLKFWKINLIKISFCYFKLLFLIFKTEKVVSKIKNQFLF